MPNNKIQFTLEPIVDAKSALSGAAQLEKIFKNLKVSPELKQTFNNIFANAAKDIKQVEKGLQEGFKTNKDVTNYEQGLKGLVTLAKNLGKEFKNLNQNNLGEIFGTVDSEELLKAQKAVNELTESTKKSATEIIDKFGKSDGATGAMKRFADNLKAAGEPTQQLDTDMNRLVATLRKYKTADGNIIDGKEERVAAINAMSEAYKHLKDAYGQGGDAASELAAARQKVENIKASGAEEGAKAYTELLKILEQLISKMPELVEQQRQSAESSLELNKSLDGFKNKVKYFLSLENGVQLFKRAVRSAFETVKELDKAMTETAVVTDFSVGDMWSQLPEYTERANELGVSIKSVYEAATLYYQQGLSTNEVMQLTNATLRMARIAGLEAAEATDRMTNALRGFNMELNEANADRVADVYSKLAAISASDVDEISTAMTKVASLASSANMEFETTAAFLSQIIETTRESAETAGTALKTVVARFSEVKKLYSEGDLLGKDEEGEDIDVNKVSAALRTAGIDLNEYFTGAKGLDDIFMELAKKWDSLDQVQQRYIATMAAGSRQQSRFIALMQNYGRTQELVSAAYNSGGASMEQYQKTLESLDSKLARLNNSWNTFLLGLTNSNLIKGAVDALNGLVGVLNKLSSSFGKVGSLTRTFGEGLLALGGSKLAKTLSKNLLGVIGEGLGTKKGTETGTGFIKGVAQSIKKGIGDVAAPFKELNNFDELKKQLDLKEIAALGKEFDSLSIKAENTSLSNEELAQTLERQQEIYTLQQQSIQKFNGELDKETIANYANNESVTIGTVEKEKNALAEEQVNAAKKRGILATITATMAELKRNVSLGQSTIGLKIQGTWLEKTAFWQNIVNMKLWAFLAIAAAVVVAIILIVNAIKRANEEQRKNSLEYKLEQISKATEDMTSAAGAAKEAYDSLAESLKKVAGYKEDIEKLTVGSQEWKKAVAENNAEIISLINKFPELREYVKVEDGYLKLDTESKEVKEVLNKQLDKELKLQSARLLLLDKQEKIGRGIDEKELSGLKGTGDVTHERYVRGEKQTVTEKLYNVDIGNLLGDKKSTFARALAGDATTLKALKIESTDPQEILKALGLGDIKINDDMEAVIQEWRNYGKELIGDTFATSSKTAAASEIASTVTDNLVGQAILTSYLSEANIDAVVKKTAAEITKTDLINAGYQAKTEDGKLKYSIDGTEFKEVDDSAVEAVYAAMQAGFMESLAKGFDINTILKHVGSKDELLAYRDSLEQNESTQDLADFITKNIDIFVDAIERNKEKVKHADIGALLTQYEAFGQLNAKILSGEQSSTISEEEYNKLYEIGGEEVSKYFVKGAEGYTFSGKSFEDFAHKFVVAAEEALNKEIKNGNLNLLEIEQYRQTQYYKMAAEGDYSFANDGNAQARAQARTSLEGLGASTEASNQIMASFDVAGALQAYKELNEQGFDTKAVEEYAKYLLTTKEMLGSTYVQALKVATANKKLNSSYKNIVDTYDDWRKAAKKVKEGINLSSEESGAYGQLKKDVANLLDTTPELAAEFIETGENLDLVDEAAKGTDGSIDNLKDAFYDFKEAAAKDIIPPDKLQECESDLDTIRNYILNTPDLEVGAYLEDGPMIEAMNHLVESGAMTREQLAELLKGTFEATLTEHTEPILGYEIDPQTGEEIPVVEGYITIPEWSYQYIPNKANTNTLEDYGRGKNGGGSGGGGSSEEKPTYWENPYDELYNKVEEINEALRTREALERKYQKLIENENATEAELRKAYADQLKQLDHEIELQKELEAGRKRQIQNAGQQIYTDSEGNRSTFDELGVTKYAHYDFDTGRIVIDWEGLEEIAADPNRTEEGEAAEAYISYLEEHVEMFEDVRDTVWDMEDRQKEIREQLIENKLSLENRVLDALVAKRQEEIDTLSAINDSITESTSKMIDSMQDSIAQERQQRSNEKTEQDIADKEARLAYLRMDTSGANAGQIKQLEKEIEDARQNYEDSLVDQAIQQMRDDADKAAEQRAQQISMMKSQLDWEKKNGELWEEVQGLIKGAWLHGENGALNVNSDLFTLLKNSEAFNSLSELGKKNWIDEISKAIRSAVGDENAGKDNNSDNNNNNNDNNNSTGGVAHNPNPSPEEIKTPTYTNYKVKSGDTLTSIAKKFGLSSWQPIYEANKDIIQNPNDIYTWMTLKIPKYKTGGLADFTGPAWLDGTKSSPELVLNADDTKNFISLKNILASLFNNNPFNTQGATAGDAYFDIDINVDELANDYDVDQLVDRVKQQIYDNSMYRNVNTLNFMR